MTTETWTNAAFPPDTCRTVRAMLKDGRIVDAFYWRAERLWYAREGSKRKSNALAVAGWSELVAEKRRREEGQ